MWVKENLKLITWESIWIGCFIYYHWWLVNQPVREITTEFDIYATIVALIPIVLLLLIFLPMFSIFVDPLVN